jgi:hypothetical protein
MAQKWLFVALALADNNIVLQLSLNEDDLISLEDIRAENSCCDQRKDIKSPRPERPAR